MKPVEWQSYWGRSTGPTVMFTESGDRVRIDTLIGSVVLARGDARDVARHLRRVADLIDDLVPTQEVRA